MTGRLVICSKSEWEPPIRREHAWAEMASERGHAVTFIERPSDIRTMRTLGVSRFITRLRGEALGGASPGIEVRARTVLVPGHRDRTAAAVNATLLRSVLRRAVSAESTVVVCWPWDWPALARVRAARRVFDMADDWGELMPGRAARFGRHYEQIAAEADEIVVVNPELSARFPGREPLVIRNGVSASALAAAPVAGEPGTMVHVGTLTRRFDAELMRAVMERLPSWRLVLVGACSYPGLGSAPAAELKRLLALPGRVTWTGPLRRDAVLPILDRAAVAVLPSRPEWSLGQDSMKFYDYAARGRPVVTTRWFGAGAAQCPPHTIVADDPDGFARGVSLAASQGTEAALDRVRWAAANTWTNRWPAWSGAVFGGHGD